MVKKCVICKKKQPVFNFEGSTIATHCKTCADPKMIDIKSKKCIICKKTRPYFNFENSSEATHCKTCAEPKMIDVKNRKCSKCKTRASYGIPCNVPSSCAYHKTKGMIKSPNAKCKKKNCNNTATFGIKNPIHCELHKNKDDINLVERFCEQCGKLDVLINGICLNFCNQEEKYTEYRKQQKTKELRVLKILTENIGEPTEYNERVDYNCGKQYSEQKEIGYDCKTHIVFVEVDENQHKSYCELGEINRMKNIYFDGGGIPTVFIRYNPDKKDISQKRKEETLIKWTVKFMKEVPKTPLNVLYLFYDNQTDKCYEIDPYDNSEFHCDECKKIFYIADQFDEHLKETDSI
jgi:hypothetical protein